MNFGGHHYFFYFNVAPQSTSGLLKSSPKSHSHIYFITLTSYRTQINWFWNYYQENEMRFAQQWLHKAFALQAINSSIID